MKRTQDQAFTSQHYTVIQLIKLYWQSNQRFSAYVFLAVVLFLTISLVGIDLIFNYWYNFFYNALQAYNKRAVVRLLVIFFMLAGVYIIMAVYRYYLSQLFGLRWRKWLTEQFVSRWLQNYGYYYLENFDEKTDNPDQRIQEDIASLVSYSIDLTIGLVGAVTTFFVFIYVLWTLSGTVTLHVGSFFTLRIPGYLVWVGAIYALIGTFFTFKIGRPLVHLNFEQQRREATFRFAAVDLRSHAENVALYKGEEHQKHILFQLFDKVLANWYMIINRQKTLLWFTSGYNQVSVVLPLLIALPNYFDKVFLLGGLMQSLQAFNRVQDSLSFIVNSYTSIAQWQAVTARLTTFMNHLTEAEKKAEKENQLKVGEHPQNVISVQNVTIKTPDGELLLKNINEKFVHGQHYLIKGISGIGKSTFVRTLAGIWPYAQGAITFPEKKQVMYLPQKPYMPIGTLTEAILFPDKTHPEFEKQLDGILQDCHLQHLIPHLKEKSSWSEHLSPGEQQRIAFARILLHKPDWVFLDESTSMLDLANEKHLYNLLKSKLPHCTVVSVGHHSDLESFHSEVIDIAKYGNQEARA